jgi:predicted TIM-barrel fold metal-dependent hydrolase
MSALATVQGRIRDTDSHEHVTSYNWAKVFGPQMGALSEFFEELHEPDATNSFTAPVERDDAPISPETTWRRGPWAPGALDMERRLQVLDFFGVQEQLVVSTVPGLLAQILVSAPIELIGPSMGIDMKQVAARVGLGELEDNVLQAACTSMGDGLFDEWNDWCINTAKVSPRLRPTAFLDTADIKKTVADIEKLAASGIRAINIPSGMPPGGMSPGHPDVDPLWEAFVANDVAVIFHAGGDFGILRSPAWPHYGPQNVMGRYKSLEINMDPYSVSFLHLGVQNIITVMIFGGVFERFPTLRVGSIENGASWVGPTAENCKLVGEQFRSLTKHLSLTPGEYLQRNVRVAPFFWEPIDRYIERFGLEDVYVYGSDYPHNEGGWDPAAQHAERLERLGPKVMEKFFVTNAELLMP